MISMLVNEHLLITMRRHRQAHDPLCGMHRRCPRACADRKGGVEQPVGRADEQGLLHPVHRGGHFSPFGLLTGLLGINVGAVRERAVSGPF